MGTRILLVDDDRDAREILAAFFEHEGARVVHARDGGHALTIARRDSAFDALISDLSMPTTDGWNLVGALRRRRDRFASVPAFAVSGHVGDEHRRRALLEGFDEVFAKPLDPAHLVSHVASALARRRR